MHIMWDALAGDSAAPASMPPMAATHCSLPGCHLGGTEQFPCCSPAHLTAQSHAAAAARPLTVPSALQARRQEEAEQQHIGRIQGAAAQAPSPLPFKLFSDTLRDTPQPAGSRKRSASGAGAAGRCRAEASAAVEQQEQVSPALVDAMVRLCAPVIVVPLLLRTAPYVSRRVARQCGARTPCTLPCLRR